MKNKLPARTHKLTDKEKEIVETIARERNRVFDRFPMVFTLLTTFGLVATFYGFERLIDRNAVLADHPLILLSLGISILLFTGTLYNKLK